MKRTLIATLVSLFLLGITSTAMATPIVSTIDWLGSSTIGWLKLVSTVTTGTGGYAFDYLYDLSFATDATHTKYYDGGSGQSYVMHFKVFSPLQIPVSEMTTPSGWIFNNSSPDYFIWDAQNYNDRLYLASGPKSFAVHSDFPPTRVSVGAWDGRETANGNTFGPAPEPTSMLLLGMGILGLLGLGRKKS